MKGTSEAGPVGARRRSGIKLRGGLDTLIQIVDMVSNSEEGSNKSRADDYPGRGAEPARSRSFERYPHRSRSRQRSRERRPKVNKFQRDERRRRWDDEGSLNIPRLDSTLVPFRKFMEKQPQNVDTKKAKEHYQKYKKNWIRKENQIFFEQHREDAWFLEKYDPFVYEKLQNIHEQQTKKVAESLIARIRSGEFEKLDWRITEEKLNEIENSDEEAEREQGLSAFEKLLKDSFDAKQAPWYSFDPDHLTIFIKPIPKSLSKLNLKEYFQKLPGFESISLSEPLKKQDFVRYCWVSFTEELHLTRALQMAGGPIIKNQSFNLIKSSSNRKKARFVRMYPKERLAIDVAACINLIKAFDSRYEVEGNPIPEMKMDLSKQLDLCQFYLRRAYAYDYFSAQRYADERLLATKCGLIHFRIQISDPEYDTHNFLTKAQTEADKRADELRHSKKPQPANEWLLNQICKVSTDEKVQDCKCKCGQKFTKVAELNKHVDTVHPDDEEKVCKCLMCKKKFREPKFLFKHFETKHIRSFRCLFCKEKFSDEAQVLAHCSHSHEERRKDIIEKETLRRYSEDENKITNNPMVLEQYNSKEERTRGGMGRRQFRYNPKDRYRDRRRDPYNDLDDPANTVVPTSYQNKSLINYLDI